MLSDRREQFDAIFEQDQRAVYAYLFGHLQNREDAKDILQETFLRVWKNLERLPPVPSERRHWIFRVAKNLVTDHYRRSKSVDVLDKTVSNMDTSPEIRLELKMLIEAIRCLPERERIVFSMSVLSGLNSREIGESLRMPEGSVRFKVSEIRKKLATKFGDNQ